MIAPAMADQVTPVEFMAVATESPAHPPTRPISGNPSGVNVSGPLMKLRTGAVASEGKRRSAFSK